MDNEQLVARIRAGEDEAENMLQLYDQTKNFIRMLAVKFTYGAELEDLEQEGYIGLCEAVRHYDADSGVKFLSYAAFWIKQSMRRYIENCGSTVRIPSGVHSDIRKYRQIHGEYLKCYGREPSDKEMMAFLRVSEEKFIQIRKAAQMGQIRSLSEPIGGEDEDITLEDSVASGEDMEEDIIRRLDQENLKRELWIAVDSLPETQRAVIRCRYLEGKTLKDTGEAMGVTGNAVREQERKAMRALRMPRKCRKFRQYHEEYLSAHAMHHVGVQSFQRTCMSEVELAVLFGYQ